MSLSSFGAIFEDVQGSSGAASYSRALAAARRLSDAATPADETGRSLLACLDRLLAAPAALSSRASFTRLCAFAASCASLPAFLLPALEVRHRLAARQRLAHDQ